MKHLLRLISILGHPLLIFPLTLGLLVSQRDSWALLGGVFALCFVGPFSFFLYSLKTKRISDFDIYKRTQRYPIYAVSLLGMLASLIFIHFFGSEELTKEFLQLFILAVLLVTLNFKTKVSIHVALIATFAVVLVNDYGVGLWVFSLIPLMAWSRVALHRHTVLEVILGGSIPLLLQLAL
jgi:hypothetical protein